METITTLKQEGNAKFKAGLKAAEGSTRRQLFIDACMKYAAALEAIVKIECTTPLPHSLTRSHHSGEVSNDNLAELKPNLFLNLAMTNFQLGDYKETRRCCNAAIAFINDASLRMNELGEVHDINIDKDIIEPIRPDIRNMVAKVLFRRAKALFEDFQYEMALSDIQRAALIVDNDKNIVQFLEKVKVKVNSIKKDDQKVVDESNSVNKNDFRFVSDHNGPDAESVNEIDADIYGEKCTLDSSTINLCHNGGLCLMRHAFWSQTVREVTVHISVKYIVSFLKSLVSSNGSSVHVDSGGSCQVDFKTNSCNIKPRESSSPDHIVNLVLSYCILPDDCTWFTTTVDSIDYIVLMLSKAPPVTEYPGCEWWDRVFEDDEKIDTMTCTVGADVSQLPEHAQLRAYQEHARFLALGRHEKEQELSALSQGKQVFCKAELDTREKAQAEDRAVQEVPQRAGMLEALRDEFPNIQFSAK